jgi:hypothetical protein
MKKERYFYTTHTPYEWSSGPHMSTLNDEYMEIASLEEAKALAEKHANPSTSRDCVVTTYGVEYSLED